MTQHIHRYRESREDRNKRIAIQAIELAERAAHLLEQARSGIMIDEDIRLDLNAFHDRWRGEGVEWTRPSDVVHEPHEWLTAGEMASYIDKPASTIRRWGYRGRIRVEYTDDGTPIYNVGQVLAHEAARGTQRALV